ncbi:MAG: LPP20 family lipoprotein [Deltaproteobacteria bacterium]
MVKKVSLLCLSTLLLFANTAFPQDVVDELPKGSINWSKGTVTAKGSGVAPSGAANQSQARLLAERAAISDARRNLLETVGEVRVDASSTVNSMMTKNDVITSRISGIVKGSAVTGKWFLDDGTVEVTVEMPITGAFLDVMLTEVKAAPSITMTIPLPKPAKKDTPKLEIKVPVVTPDTKKVVSEPSKTATPPVPPVPTVPAKPTEPVKESKLTEPAKAEVPAAPKPEKIDLSKVNYSGLIIDAREVEVKPALMPKVLNEKGEVIYSSANMQKEEAVKTGVVGYAKEVDAARKHPRVTETPIILAALKGSGEKKSDVIISGRDAQVITTTEPTLGYLKKGRVMIVYK